MDLGNDVPREKHGDEVWAKPEDTHCTIWGPFMPGFRKAAYFL